MVWSRTLIRSRAVMPYGVPQWMRIVVTMNAVVVAILGMLPREIQDLLPLNRRRERAVRVLHR